MKVAKKSEDYTLLLEKYESDQQVKKKLMNQCAGQQFSLMTKEEEIVICSRYIVDLEQKVKYYYANLENMKIKYAYLNTSVESLKEELNIKEASWKKEKEQLSCMYLRFLAEVETLRSKCEKEQAEIENLKHQVQAAKEKNVQLRQIAESGKMDKEALRLEADRWNEDANKIQEEQVKKVFRFLTDFIVFISPIVTVVFCVNVLFLFSMEFRVLDTEPGFYQGFYPKRVFLLPVVATYWTEVQVFIYVFCFLQPGLAGIET